MILLVQKPLTSADDVRERLQVAEEAYHGIFALCDRDVDRRTVERWLNEQRSNKVGSPYVVSVCQGRQV